MRTPSYQGHIPLYAYNGDGLYVVILATAERLLYYTVVGTLVASGH